MKSKSHFIYNKIANIVRILLGMEFLINGINWWVKLIGPYPSISDYIHREPSNGIVGALIKSGVLFHFVKAVEVLSGVALLSNRFVPLALVASFPVTVIVFVVDVIMSGHLRSRVMGVGAMMMSIFLMFAYIRHYLPMLEFKTNLGFGDCEADYVHKGRLEWLNPQASNIGSALMVVGGAVAMVTGLVMIAWVFTMIVQHFASA